MVLPAFSRSAAVTAPPCAAGVVVAVSNPAHGELVGHVLGEPWVEACLKLDDSQRYAVTPFAPTPLYAGRPTYAYLAALRAPEARVQADIEKGVVPRRAGRGTRRCVLHGYENLHPIILLRCDAAA